MALSALIGVFSHNLQVGSIELDENIHQDLIKKRRETPRAVRDSETVTVEHSSW